MDTFAALADPTRRNIVEMVARRGRLSATDISKNFNSSAPAISQHLKILRETRLLRMEKQAQQRIYSIDPSGMKEVAQWVNEYKKYWDESFDKLDNYLENLKVQKRKEKEQNDQ